MTRLRDVRRAAARLRDQAGHEVTGRGITPAEAARHARDLLAGRAPGVESTFLAAFHSLCRSMPEYHLPSTAYRSRTLANPQFHANLDAPACERRLRSCAGLGSKANRYAWMTFTELRSPALRPDADFSGKLSIRAGRIRVGDERPT